MNVMRNGFFQMEDDSYWTTEHFTSFDVTTDDPVVGTHSAKLVTSAAPEQYLRNSDLIEVNGGDLIEMGAYIDGACGGYVATRIRTYTADGTYIGLVEGSHFKPLAYPLYICDTIRVPVWASYISFELYFRDADAAETVYVDLCGLQVTSPVAATYKYEYLLWEDGITAAGDTKTYHKLMDMMERHYAILDFDAGGGHTADATIKIVEDSGIGGWLDVATFTVTAIDMIEKIELPHLIGRKVALDYTFGAGVINCDIHAQIIGRR